MKRTRDQIKAELMKKAEREIDRLLDWEEKAARPTLTQFENEMLMTRKALSEAMIPGEAKSTERMGAAMDGAKMYVLGQGWKEFKVGCLFEIAERPTFVKETLEWEVLGHAVNNTYVAHLGGPEIFGQKAWAEAHRRHWTLA